jgi:hypothetical protein
MADFNRNAAEDGAVREFHLASGPCDYLQFVDGNSTQAYALRDDAFAPDLMVVDATCALRRTDRMCVSLAGVARAI